MFPFNPVTLPIGFYVACCTIIGVIGNITIVLVTYSSIHLRSSCNFIIAVNCFCDALHLSGHISYVFYLFTQEEIAQDKCFYYHIIPQIGLFSCASILLVLALDRLIASSLVARYSTFQQHIVKYTGCLMSIPLFFITTQLYLSFSNKRNDIFVICDVPTSAYGVLSLHSQVNAVLYPVICLIYMLVLFIIRKNGANTNFKLISKSISVTLFIILISWLFSIVAVNVSYYLNIDDHTKEMIVLYSGVGINTAIASHFFIYYKFSSLYRREIRRIIFCRTASSHVSSLHIASSA